MRRTLPRHVTYANVMATVEVFIALGGAAFAATFLPPGSVGRAQLQANAVNSAKVANRSPRAVDFAEGQLKAGPRARPARRARRDPAVRPAHAARPAPPAPAHWPTTARWTTAPPTASSLP